MRAVRRRWPVVVACVLVTPLAALGVSIAQEKQYTASSSLLFRDDTLGQTVVGITTPSNGAQDAARNADTNSKLVALGPVGQDTAPKVGLTPRQVDHRVTVVPGGESDVVLVQATGTDPMAAARLADAYAQTFVERQQRYRRGLIIRARRSVQAELAGPGKSYPAAQQRDLRRSINQLGVLASLQTGGVQLVAAAETPTAPSAPRTSRNVVLAVVLGLALGLGLVALLERLDTRIRRPEDLTAEFDRPLLGVLPAISRKIDPLDDPAVQESVQLLRVSMGYVGLGNALRVLAVTSASPDEGKSSLSTSLASALAHAGSSVLLIEADVRRGNLAARLKAPIGAGLVDVLSGRVGAPEAIVSTARWGDGSIEPAREEGQLSLLQAGPRVPNPGDLIESAAMADLIDWARDEYDLVVIDTPPLLSVPDTMSLLPSVDGTVIVARAGRSQRTAVRALAERVRTIGQRPVGIVMFGAPASSSAYGYDYATAYSTTEVARPYWGPETAPAPVSAS